MTDQDRRDHELAAKAAGYVLTWKDGSCKGGAYCGAFIEREGFLMAWRPKEDDGDSLRLSADARIVIQHARRDVFGIDQDCLHPHHEDGVSYEATRLAVFRCAVEIGRAKQ